MGALPRWRGDAQRAVAETRASVRPRPPPALLPRPATGSFNAARAAGRRGSRSRARLGSHPLDRPLAADGYRTVVGTARASTWRRHDRRTPQPPASGRTANAPRAGRARDRRATHRCHDNQTARSACARSLASSRAGQGCRSAAATSGHAAPLTRVSPDQHVRIRLSRILHAGNPGPSAAYRVGHLQEQRLTSSSRRRLLKVGDRDAVPALYHPDVHVGFRATSSPPAGGA